MKRTWSPAAESKLRALYGREKLPRLAFLLKRTEKAVRSRAKLLGIKTGSRHLWTKRQLQVLRREYADASTALLVEITGHSKLSVYQMAQKLGLRKSAAFHEDAKRSGRFDKLSRAGERFRYPKGHAPANKGMRRPGWAPGHMALTQFKKGQKPHTWKPVGTERRNADNYLERKISDTGYTPRDWRGVHRILWEEAHGPIPPKHLVAFKDGNRMNVVLENLELITMGENARRNRMWNKYPKELADVLQLRGAIKRQINRRAGRREVDDHERRKTERRIIRNARRPSKQRGAYGSRSREGGRAGR